MKKILFFLAITIFAVSCKKDFGSLNDDTKKPTNVPPGALFAFAEKQLVDIMTTTNVNQNIFRMFAQQWTETTYIDEANFDVTTRNIPQNFWNAIYVGTLKNLQAAKDLVPAGIESADVKANRIACIELLNVYTYDILVSTYGNIPYSQALDFTNVHPVYDDAATVNTDLLRRLDEAVNSIKTTEDGFGASDLLFGGNMDSWKTFANSLRLRMGMNLADADAAKAAALVVASESGTIQTGALEFHYLSSPPNTNPIWVNLIQSARKDFVAANTIMDAMKGLNDPRIPLYFSTDAAGGYSGGIYASSNSYATFSKPSNTLTAADFPSTFFDAAETHFLLAEAKERGMSVSGTAAEHYEAGIRASITAWGGSTADADTYLAQPSVAYATAVGDWKQKIGTQSWIAMYNRGFEAWSNWRRLDQPLLNVSADGEWTYDDIPKRLTYPVQEQNLNKTNYDAAAAAVGGDKLTTKLFWDKN